MHVYIGPLSNRVRLKCRHLMWENRASDSFRALAAGAASLALCSALWRVFNLDTGSAPGEINFERRAAWSYKRGNAARTQREARLAPRSFCACADSRPNYLPRGSAREAKFMWESFVFVSVYKKYWRQRQKYFSFFQKGIVNAVSLNFLSLFDMFVKISTKLLLVFHVWLLVETFG